MNKAIEADGLVKSYGEVDALQAVSADPDWGLIATDVGLLTALLIASLWVATRAFRTYQKQV